MILTGGTHMDSMLFLNIIQTALLLVIAAGTGYLVYRSSRPAKSGTRKSLASRRQDVYNDVKRILTMLGHTGEMRKEDLVDFRSRTQDASLLFDTEIAAYVDEIYTRGVKLMSASELLNGTSLSVGEERDRITVEHTRQMIWLADQLAKIGKKFERYTEPR